MPTYGGTPVLTIGKAEEAKRTVQALFDKHGYPDAPALFKPGHEGPMWVLVLSGDPGDWPVWVNDIIGDDLEAIGVFAEPVNPACLALYPTG